MKVSIKKIEVPENFSSEDILKVAKAAQDVIDEISESKKPRFKCWCDVLDYYRVNPHVYPRHLRSCNVLENDPDIDVYKYKILALIARALNGDWKPDWSDPRESKWFIRCDSYDDRYHISYCYELYYPGMVYFKDEDVALKALQLFKDSLRFYSIDKN